ncbi:hypothetical protein Fmac_010085 [Flemingia macrophylla]|uniref:EamA domain-containing protein n=1 Tax=Flemingia macrophylla TaxID=520843 RepID=A0ABD1N245_9FABA
MKILQQELEVKFVKQTLVAATMDTWNVVHALKPVLLMVIVQISNAWVNVLYKLALNDGMNLSVIVAYRYVFATVFIAPLAFLVESGALPQNLNMEAIALTSVTFTTAISNLIPAITFIISLSFGLERLNLKTVAGKAKIIGTITGVSGAMILTFIKGAEIKMLSFHLNLFNNRNSHVVHRHATSGVMTIFGALASVASNVSYALWLIIQAKMSERYPCPYSSTALMSLMGALLSIAFAFCIERDLSQWRLGWNVRLITVAYAGIVVSGVMVAAISWCVRTRGPLFVSVFSPLMLVVVAFAGSTILDEKLYIGSIMGSMLIICGLYVVLWGKHKEMRKNKSLPSESTNKTDSVDIMVKSRVEDENNHNTANEQSWENGPENNIAFAFMNVLYKLAINDGMSVRMITEKSTLFSDFHSLEKLDLRRAPGKAKVLGTITGVGGAMILTFLKGVEINIWTFHINLLHKKGATGTLNGDSGSKLLGIFCGLGSCLCFALWLIIQAQMSKEFPSHYSSTALMSFMGAIQATVFALCVEKDWSQWRLGWSIRLLTAAYSRAFSIKLVECIWMRME